MKGIMLNIVSKLILGLYLSTHLVSAATKNTNSTTTTTTSKPGDLSGAETYETSVRYLRPGESVSRSVSYSQSSHKYEQENPGYDNGRYEEQTVQYEKDPGHKEEYHNGNVNGNYHGQQLGYSQPEDYNGNSYEDAHQQKQQVNNERGYEGSPEQRNQYSYPDPTGKHQTSYAHQGVPFESTREGKGYGEEGRPPFHYAYEVTSHHQQQDSYDPQNAPNNDGKSGYESGGTESYSPKVPQQPEYYPDPVPTKYVLQDIQKEEGYTAERENYFPVVPREAGYATSGQKEPGYLQSPPNEPSYSKQAGYSTRDSQNSGFLPMIPKEKSSSLTEDGKVSLYIKHLGHKTPGTNQYVTKERQGFLLLPVEKGKVEEKLRELKGQYKQEYRQNYQDNKQSNYKQRPQIVKQFYVQPKVTQYPVNVKAQQGPSYTLEQVSGKPDIQTIVSYGSNGAQRSAVKPTVYVTSQYENSKVYAHSAKEDAGPVAYIPQTAANYEEVPDIKSYSSGSQLYNTPHKGISSVTGPVKYESLYGKSPEYATPYDVTTAHKSTQVKHIQPSTYTALSHSLGYPRIVSSIANKGEANHPATRALLRARYNIDGRQARVYEHPAMDAEKSVSIFLQKPKEPEVVAFRPSPYSSKGRVSAKSLVEDFGLHDYESFLSKPRQSSGVGSLYYDLHSFPAQHGYTTRFGYRRSGTVAKKPSL